MSGSSERVTSPTTLLVPAGTNGPNRTLERCSLWDGGMSRKAGGQQCGAARAPLVPPLQLGLTAKRLAHVLKHLQRRRHD